MQVEPAINGVQEDAREAGPQIMETINEEIVPPSGPNGKFVDLSLQIPPKPVGFGSSRNGKDLLESQDSSKGSLAPAGFLPSLSFKKKEALLDGEGSSLLNLESNEVPASPVLASFIAAFSWKRCVSLPVRPAPNLSPSVVTPSRISTEKMPVEQHTLHRPAVSSKVSRSLSVPMRNVVIVRSASFATRREPVQTDISHDEDEISPIHMEEDDEEIPEEKAKKKMSLTTTTAITSFLLHTNSTFLASPNPLFLNPRIRNGPPNQIPRPTTTTTTTTSRVSSSSLILNNRGRRRSCRATVPRTVVSCRRTESSEMDSLPLDCVGTGLDVESVVSSQEETSSSETDNLLLKKSTFEIGDKNEVLLDNLDFSSGFWDLALLVSPFFFWGTAMVAMKQVLPKAGPFFVSAFRLIPAGLILIGFSTSRGRKQPSGTMAWVSIILFGLVDATCFQGFLAEGLQRTSAGLGSVIIDSQPLTVAVLAALLFGESIGLVGAAGLVLGVVGLLLLEVPAVSFEGGDFSLWGSGEWWMLLAAQSMAVGTVMVRWVSKYCDPVMATGWHMVIGGLPLLTISVLNHDPAISGSLKDLTSSDILALLYTSIFGSAISYGVFFYNATRGSLTKLSSLTFLTPMFASIFGFLYLGETFSPLQLFGAFVTLVAIYMVNYRSSSIE